MKVETKHSIVDYHWSHAENISLIYKISVENQS